MYRILESLLAWVMCTKSWRKKGRDEIKWKMFSVCGKYWPHREKSISITQQYAVSVFVISDGLGTRQCCHSDVDAVDWERRGYVLSLLAGGRQWPVSHLWGQYFQFLFPLMCQSTINLFKKQTVITMIHIRLDNFFHIFHVMVKS